MVELKKVVLVQNVNEKEPTLESVAVENEQPSPKDSTIPNKTTISNTTISKKIIAAVVFTVIFVNILIIGNNFIRSRSSEQAHLQGQIQEIKGLYDQSTLPPKPMPNHRIYPEADLYASEEFREEFRKEMAKRLNEQQQKLREIKAQSAAGHNNGSGNGPQMQN